MTNYAKTPVTRKACPKTGRCNFGRMRVQPLPPFFLLTLYELMCRVSNGPVLLREGFWCVTYRLSGTLDRLRKLDMVQHCKWIAYGSDGLGVSWTVSTLLVRVDVRVNKAGVHTGPSKGSHSVDTLLKFNLGRGPLGRGCLQLERTANLNITILKCRTPGSTSGKQPMASDFMCPWWAQNNKADSLRLPLSRLPPSCESLASCSN